MGSNCSTDTSVRVKKAPAAVARPRLDDSHLATTANSSVYDDNLIAIENVPEIERFEGDVVESDVDDFGASITAPPQEILNSVQSVSNWFQTVSSPEAVDESYVGEQQMLSPSSDVGDERKNDAALVEAERLAPTGHYDATSVIDRRQLASRRAVDPLKLATPKLPQQAKKSFFGF